MEDKTIEQTERTRNKVARSIESVKRAIEWDINVAESKRYTYHRNLIDIQRELENIRFALSEKCSIAAFGESQMGKSYLVSAMLSEPGTPFQIKNCGRLYNFIDEINPSAPNSTIEATGVVTRFTTNPRDGSAFDDFLKIRMLSVTDIVLVLAEAYYNQVVRNSRNVIDIIKNINDKVKSVEIMPNSNALLTEVDVSYIENYMRTSTIRENCDHLFSSDLLQFLMRNVKNISTDDLLMLLTLIWNENKDFSRLFYDLIRTYQALNFQSTCYVDFRSVLRKHGTLLDVARLDEMYPEPNTTRTKDSIADATVKLSQKGNGIIVKKSFLSALVAELNILVEPGSDITHRAFLGDLDILDFPGLKPKQTRNEDELSKGLNLATVYRRGKVTYLFNKYSRAKRISSLLFCHNNNDSKDCTMGGVIEDWVNNNVGRTPSERSAYVNDIGGSPLLIISTWFNKDLDYNNETVDADLNERWDRRFKTVLAKDVLQSLGKDDHWFNNWTTNEKKFKTLFMLRDFKYSKAIYEGYDPDNKIEEGNAIIHEKFPDFLEQLRNSFVTNDFVREHFASPEDSWDEAATSKNDGTKRIMRELNLFAPKILRAQLTKFERDCDKLVDNLREQLMQEYHTDNPMEQISKSKKEVGRINVSLDIKCGKDPYFWGNLMDSLMIPEHVIYEKVFSQIAGKELNTPLSGPDTEIFMAAGLDTAAEESENLAKLCDYLGVTSKSECEETLQTLGVDINQLLKKVQMVQSQADQLVRSIEHLWQTEFLNVKIANKYKVDFPIIDVMLSNLGVLYNFLDVHTRIKNDVQRLMDSIVGDKLVGIVSDYLAMAFNSFINTYGYHYFDDEQIEDLFSKNDEFKLNIDTDLIKDVIPSYGIDLLREIDSLQSALASDDYSQGARTLQKRLPQYRNRWQWQHRMRAAFALVCGLPDYDVVANDNLRKIIESLN